MTSLRDHARGALREGELTPEEAAADFAHLAARARRPSRVRIPAIIALASAAGCVAYLVASRVPAALPVATEIYIRVEGEEASDALSLTIVTNPEVRSSFALVAGAHR